MQHLPEAIAQVTDGRYANPMSREFACGSQGDVEKDVFGPRATPIFVARAMQAGFNPTSSGTPCVEHHQPLWSSTAPVG